MAKQFTVQDFFKRFGTDDACLDHLMAVRYGERVQCPKCSRVGRFVRITGIPAYACPTPRCGHPIHPMAGTPFARTHTALQKWFYAMYLFTTTRHGVSAKELQRQLGVTYKCAWRIGHEIRKYMAEVDGDGPLSGTVEVDETMIGGHAHGLSGRGAQKYKSVVFGMIEKGGNVMTRVVPDVKRASLAPHIVANIEKGTVIHSDELKSYKFLNDAGYEHKTVHHGIGEYVSKDGVHTNSIECYWSLLKRSILGTHIHVSKKHLAKYLGEFEYRHNMRKTPELMFSRLVSSF